MSSKKKIFLIDGHAFIFRAYYAMPPLTNAAGENTGAVYGFWVMVKKILEKEKPDAVVVCFDRGEPTFRHKKYKEYKANRPEAPDELIEQFGFIRDLVKAHNIPVFEKAGFEGDDLLGTLAKKAEKDGFEVFIATSDKDAMQLVNKNIKIYQAHRDGMIVDEAKVKEKYQGLGPESVIDIMGLMGDSSDNVPGVPSVGEKTAIKLIQEYGSIEGIYKNLEKITRAKLKQKLEENKEMADLSRELVTIDCDVPIKYAAKDMMVRELDEKKTQTLFKRFEFRAFIKSADTTQKAAVDTKQKRNYTLLFELEELEKLAKTLQTKKLISLDTETTSIDSFLAELVGVSVSFKKGEAYFIPIKHESGHVVSLKNFKKIMGPILSDPKIKKCGQNIKYDCHVLARHDLRVEGISFDTMIASYLINPAKLNHNLDDISREYLGIEKVKTGELLGSGRGQITMDKVPLGKLTEYASEDADCVFQLVPLLEKVLQEKKLDKLFTDLEMPLLSVLEQVEENGVTIDKPFLAKLSKQAEKDLEGLTKKIEKIAGESFNINSTKQLQEILFTKLELPVIKKTKTGISTDVSVLEKLAEDHEIAEHLLQYRERQKLKSTYMDALPELVNPDDKLIHTSFNQTITATGRLSSSNPNLQNIPIKSELGREIRKGFIPREKTSQLLSADYSQIELRVLAHLSGDGVLSKAFQEDLDIHNYTATLLYDVKDKDITRKMRYAAKTINFSIIYGKTAFGLSKDLSISVPEAAEFIEAYFKRYKKIKDYLESQKEKARKQGFLTTMMGRRSYFPDINARNGMRRQFAERAAINAPIQGSAADLIKQAMLDVSEALKKEKAKSLMIMQVHDELVFDVPRGEEDLMKKLVTSKMEGAMKLKVPLKVSVSLGKNWFKGE